MISKDLKIEIRPIPNRNNIKAFSENLEYFSQSNTIAAFVNPVTLKYDTGLSEEDKEYLINNKFPYNIDDNYIRGVAHPFWENGMCKVELKSTPMFLYPGQNLMDFIKYKYLLVNKYIYKSEEEMKSGSKSQATHYIYNEEEATTIKASGLQKRNDLNKKLSDLTLDQKRNVILILLNENTDNKNEDYLSVRLDDLLKDKEKVLELTSLLEESSDKRTLKAEIKSAIQKNVLKRTSKGIFFFENNIGFSEDDVVEFLSKLDNQEILLNIKTKIK